MATPVTTINEAITKGLINAFEKKNVQYRKINGEEYRFTLVNIQGKREILVYNSENVLMANIPESDFPV